MYYKKWKPKFEQVQKYLKDMENFNKEIENIEKLTGVIIHINQSCSTVYFKYNDYEYRISTHDKIDKGPYLSTDKDLFKEPNQINKVTNSRKNIIKHVKKILGVENEQ